MDNSACKKLTVIILLLSLGTTFSASIFSLNFGALRDTAVNNIEQVPQFLNKVINRHKQHSATINQNAYQDNRQIDDNKRVSFPYANTNPAIYQDQQNKDLINPDNRGNTDYDNVRSADNNIFNPTINKDLQGNSFTLTPSHFISKVTPGNSLNYAGSPVNIDSRGSFYDGGENSKRLLPENGKKNPADVYLSEHTVASDTDLTTEYSTTTDYWTTTDEPLNRIGAPPAVVASILG